ncbi:hypothetical protein ABIC33_004219 [Variovorax sp. 1140]|uniref:hypothetical protein n=1 Tax=Variovorax atrisoli TaxID=3394203 RepID=UPI003399159D
MQLLWLVDLENQPDLHIEFIAHEKLLDALNKAKTELQIVCYFGTANAAKQLQESLSDQEGFDSIIWFRFPLAFADRRALLRFFLNWQFNENIAAPGAISENAVVVGGATSPQAAPPSDFFRTLVALEKALSTSDISLAILLFDQAISINQKAYCGDLWQDISRMFRAGRFCLEMERKSLEGVTSVGSGSRFSQQYDFANQFCVEGYEKISGQLQAHCMQLNFWSGFSRRIELLKFSPQVVTAFRSEHQSRNYGKATGQLLLIHIFHMIAGAQYALAIGQLSYSFIFLWKAFELILYSNSLRAGTANLYGAEILHTASNLGKGVGVWFSKVTHIWKQRYAGDVGIFETAIEFRNASRVGHGLAIPSAAQLCDFRDSLIKVVEAEAARDGLAAELSLLKDGLADGGLAVALQRGLGDALTTSYRLH